MPVSDYTPTVEEVALLLRARTRDANGNLVNDFTQETVPTDVDAAGLIDLAMDEISGAIGPDIDQEFWEEAKAVGVLLSAANIELSYFPEQAAQANSMYDKLMTRYNAKMESLTADIAEESDSSVDGDGTGSSGLTADPSGGFPAPIMWGYVRW